MLNREDENDVHDHIMCIELCMWITSSTDIMRDIFVVFFIYNAVRSEFYMSGKGGGNKIYIIIRK